MRRIVIGILVAASVGIVGVFAATQLSGDAAAEPTPAQVVVTGPLGGAGKAVPTPTPTPAPAQVVVTGPLDGAGNVKVHEQGTANVDVTNGPLPISGTVNIGNFPAAPSGSLHSLTFTNGLSQFVDTSICRHVTIMARANSLVDLMLFVSPDGTTRILRGDPGGVTGNVDGYSTVVAYDIAFAEPFLQVQIQAANPEGWIWCQP